MVIFIILKRMQLSIKNPSNEFLHYQISDVYITKC